MIDFAVTGVLKCAPTTRILLCKLEAQYHSLLTLEGICGRHFVAVLSKVTVMEGRSRNASYLALQALQLGCRIASSGCLACTVKGCAMQQQRLSTMSAVGTVQH